MDKRHLYLYVEKGVHPLNSELEYLYLTEKGKIIEVFEDGSEPNPHYRYDFIHHGWDEIAGFKKALSYLGMLGTFVTEYIPVNTINYRLEEMKLEVIQNVKGDVE